MLSIAFTKTAIQTTMDANRQLFGVNAAERNWDPALNACRMLVANAIQLPYLLDEGRTDCPDGNWLTQDQLRRVVCDYNGYTRRLARDVTSGKFDTKERAQQAQELSAWFLNIYAVNGSAMYHDTEYVRYALIHPNLVPVYGSF